MSNLVVTTRHEDVAVVLDLSGDITADGEEAITTAYEQAAKATSRRILFSLANAKYINTAGISVLIVIAMGAKKAGVTLLVSGASPHYRKVFDLVRFSSFVAMFDDEPAAIASLRT